ncbi:hypothetical protein LZT04_09905, partial [Vibrio fluvialis]|nr:hypothetical protein [Vibrio fluvialis]
SASLFIAQNLVTNVPAIKNQATRESPDWHLCLAVGLIILLELQRHPALEHRDFTKIIQLITGRLAIDEIG